MITVILPVTRFWWVAGINTDVCCSKTESMTLRVLFTTLIKNLDHVIANLLNSGPIEVYRNHDSAKQLHSATHMLL